MKNTLKLVAISGGFIFGIIALVGAAGFIVVELAKRYGVGSIFVIAGSILLLCLWRSLYVFLKQEEARKVKEIARELAK